MAWEDEASFWRFLEGAGPPTLYAWDDDLPDAAAVQRALSLHLPGHSFLGATTERGANTERAAHLPDLHNHIFCCEEELPAALFELLGDRWGEDAEEKGGTVGLPEAELELALRAGADGGRCAIRAGRRVLLWRFPDGPQTAELLGAAGAFFGSLHAAARLSVYKTPDAAHRVKPDKFWGTKFFSRRTRTGSAAYEAYREVIDPLLVREAVNVVMGAGGGGGHHIAELCGGDGSLGVKVLAAVAAARGAVASFTLLERNAVLANEARARLADAAAPGGGGDGSGRGGGSGAAAVQVCVRECDVLADEAALDGLLPRPTVWLSSGSVLNGQVGSGFAVEGCLLRLVRRLRPGGSLLVSGWSCSFLYPELLAGVGLEIGGVASLPSGEAGGLESDLQRLQLFVLHKSGGEEEGEEEEEEKAHAVGEAAAANVDAGKAKAAWAAGSPLLRAIAGL